MAQGEIPLEDAAVSQISHDMVEDGRALSQVVCMGDDGCSYDVHSLDVSDLGMQNTVVYEEIFEVLLAVGDACLSVGDMSARYVSFDLYQGL